MTNGIAYLLQYVGMVYVSASASSLFVNLSVVWVALLTPLVFRERLGLKKALGVMVSLLGVVFMTTNLDFASLTQGAIVSDLLVIARGNFVGCLHRLQQAARRTAITWFRL